MSTSPVTFQSALIKMGKYSLVVIGGGPAGLFCALRAAGNGRKILIVEKKPCRAGSSSSPVRGSVISPMKGKSDHFFPIMETTAGFSNPL